MSFEANIQIEGNEEVKKFLSQLPKTMFEGAKVAFAKATLKAQSVIRTENFTHSSSGYSSDKLNSRTGDLSRSIRTALTGTELSTLSGRVYTVSPYAPIHEFGGTVKAKDKYKRVPGGPYLNIPLSDNKTAAGVMRKSAGEVFSEGGFIIKSKQGNWLVMDVAGVPMFVLKRQVYIKPRLGMDKATQDRIPEILDSLKLMALE